MKKLFNKLLKDKDDFYKDYDLKSKVDLHNYLLDQLLELESQILPAKIRYFFKNKKKYLLRLFVKFIFFLSIIFGVLFVAWFFGFRYDPKPEVEHKDIVLYVLENTDTAYIKSKIPKAKFNIIYLPDPNKDWIAYKQAMHSKFETRGYSDSASYFARRINVNEKTGNKSPSEYWGRYQLGNDARKACGIGNMSWEEFSTNPEIQEGAFKTWIRVLYRDMKPYILKYEGRFMGGYQLTTSGILSMTHNVGQDATIKFLESNGKEVPSDGNGSAVRFLSLGGYNLSTVLEK